MTSPSIGFIGFGEAGSTLASGLRSAGIERIAAFDINAHHETLGAIIRERGSVAGVRLVDSSSTLATEAQLIFSSVTAGSAGDAARQTVPFLTSRHTYVDINSVSPELKQEIDGLVRKTGASFVEAAVMAPVTPYGHKVPMLIGGAGAAEFAAIIRPYGMNVEVVSADVGKAVAVKMCRSIVVKGLEALLFECVLGASRYGADDRVFASLQETYPGIEWKKLADYAINRMVVHGERRAREMEEVARTLRATGIEPTMAEATARRQQWSAQLDLKSSFSPGGPRTYGEVLKILTGPIDSEPGSPPGTDG